MHESRRADALLLTPSRIGPSLLATLRLYIRTFWLLTAKCGGTPSVGVRGGLNVAEQYYLMCESSASHSLWQRKKKKRKNVCDYDNAHAGVPDSHQRPPCVSLVLISDAVKHAGRGE